MRPASNSIDVIKVITYIMNELPSQLANWLFNVLQPQYNNKQVAYTHLYQFLQKYFSLFRVRTQVFTSSYTGGSSLLINLYGNIFVRGLEVPVQIWVPLNYPFVEPDLNEDINGMPMVFIVADKSKGIFLKPGNFVDSQGKFYHPYLSDWYSECRATNFSSIKSFNLIRLIDILTAVIEKDLPITIDQTPVRYTPSGNPPIPPKPSKTPINFTGIPHDTRTISPQGTGLSSAHSITPGSGTPVPAKPSTSSIPLKYQTPLPLPLARPSPPNPHIPAQSTLSSSIEPFGHQRNISGQSFVQPTGPALAPKQGHISPQRSEPLTHNPDPSTSPISEPTAEADLMDRDDRNDNTSDTRKVQALHKLSSEINKLLPTLPENNNEILERVNMNTNKINGLYDQLSHHQSLALANKDILQSHLSYLTNQLAQITSLNDNLLHTHELNTRDPTNVHVTHQRNVDLDELVIPDLVLTSQLYDLVSEIKANKDTLSLINGNFPSQNELINDSNFNSCVKSVRNIGRELFWLELTKSEIAKKMGIQ